MAKIKILVVDDAELIKKTLRTVLQREGYAVVTVSDGNAAKEKLRLEDFNLVITDMNMLGVGGLELLKYIRICYPAMPTILMTGFSELIETKTAFKVGAKAFLAKPFRRDELLLAIVLATTSKPALPNTDDPKAYYRIGIDQFDTSNGIDCEVFLCITPPHFIKVVHTGENLAIEKIRKFKSKGVTALYVKKQDYAKHVGLKLILPSETRGVDLYFNEEKQRAVHEAVSLVRNGILKSSIKEAELIQAAEVIGTTLSLLCDTHGGFDLLMNLRIKQALYTHSLGVSLLSIVIAERIGWNSPATLFKISIAGLFHDIGSTEPGPVEAHPAKGAAILSALPGMSEEVIQTVLQHHETFDGRGYPAGLSSFRIIPMARLIAVAETFYDFLTDESFSFQPDSARALKRLTLQIKSEFDGRFVDALRRVFISESDNLISFKAVN